jgi:hypothetical protein
MLAATALLSFRNRFRVPQTGRVVSASGISGASLRALQQQSCHLQMISTGVQYFQI